MRYILRREMNPRVYINRDKDLALLVCYDTEGEKGLGILVKGSDMSKLNMNSDRDNVISYQLFDRDEFEEEIGYERTNFPFALRQFYQMMAYDIAFEDLVPEEYHSVLQDVVLTPLSVWDCEIREVDEDKQYASIQKLQDDTREMVNDRREYKSWVESKSHKTYFLA